MGINVSLTTFSSRNRSVAVVPAPRRRIWELIEDAATLAELTPPNKLYQAYAATQLKDLASQVAKIKTDLGKKDIAQANDPSFIAPLRDATGIFFDGGRQWRIVDSFLGTRTQREIDRY